MSQETKNVQACFPSGNKYKGEWSDGQANGHGIMTFPNMDKYDGDWENGMMNGFGKYSCYDEEKDAYTSFYEGDFVNDMKEGVGMMHFPDGSVYNGQWQANVRCGDGIIVFPNGKIFHGLWQQDKMLRGVLSLKNGDKYDGEFVDGLFDG